MSIRLCWGMAMLASIVMADSTLNDQRHVHEVPFRYGFSECLNNQRTLFYYADQAKTCADANAAETIIVKRKKELYAYGDDNTLIRMWNIAPVHGLRCDVVCEKGYYLGAKYAYVVRSAYVAGFTFAL